MHGVRWVRSVPSQILSGDVGGLGMNQHKVPMRDAPTPVNPAGGWRAMLEECDAVWKSTQHHTLESWIIHLIIEFSTALFFFQSALS